MGLTDGTEKGVTTANLQTKTKNMFDLIQIVFNYLILEHAAGEATILTFELSAPLSYGHLQTFQIAKPVGFRVTIKNSHRISFCTDQDNSVVLCDSQARTG